jgi:hypothetical protein
LSGLTAALSTTALLSALTGLRLLLAGLFLSRLLLAATLLATLTPLATLLAALVLLLIHFFILRVKTPLKQQPRMQCRVPRVCLFSMRIFVRNLKRAAYCNVFDVGEATRIRSAMTKKCPHCKGDMMRLLETVKIPNEPRVVAWLCPNCGHAESTFSEADLRPEKHAARALRSVRR